MDGVQKSSFCCAGTRNNLFLRPLDLACLSLSAGAGSSVGVPGQLRTIGCSNIDVSGLWTGGMIGRIGACCWFESAAQVVCIRFCVATQINASVWEGWFVCSQHSSRMGDWLLLLFGLVG